MLPPKPEHMLIYRILYPSQTGTYAHLQDTILLTPAHVNGGVKSDIFYFTLIAFFCQITGTQLICIQCSFRYYTPTTATTVNQNEWWHQNDYDYLFTKAKSYTSDWQIEKHL